MIPEAFAFALDHHQAGRLAEAEALYRQILAAQPGHAGALNHLGVIAYQRGQFDIAADRIRESIVLQADNPGAHSNLGAALSAMGKLDEAIVSYRHAVALKPDYAEAWCNLGVALADRGQWNEAIAAQRRALLVKPAYAEAHFNLGNALRERGLLDEAAAAYRRALASEPGYPEAHLNLGAVSYDRGRTEEAIACYRRALEVRPDYADAWLNLGAGLSALGRFEEAAAACGHALRLRPNHAPAHNNLGTALAGLKRFDEAVAEYRRALQLQPNYADPHMNLGLALAEQAQPMEAIAAFHRALQLQPGLAAAWYNLGNVLREQSRFNEALDAYRRTLQLQPGHSRAHMNIGIALAALERFEEAIEAYHRAVRLKPDDADAHYNLGTGLSSLGRFDEAMAEYQSALQIKPNYASALNNFANALKDQGEIDRAFVAYRQAIDVQPETAMFLTNLIYGMHFSPACDAAAIRRQQVRWNRQHADPLRSTWQPHDNSREPGRRLKIGYVSPDFRTHAVSFFTTPLLETHDRMQCEIYCYASVNRPDTITERLRQSADVWRDTRHDSDAQLAARVREDGIDILIDLAMHTGGTRLLSFARRPAPVQVSWLAYPGSTGVETIDYRISDRWLEVEGSEIETSGSESPVCLPDSWCCYAPIQEFPAVGPLPADRGGGVTFGFLNQFCKVHEGLLRCWARLLAAVPAAQLLMVSPGGRADERTLAFFAGEGIARERVVLVPRRPWPEFVQLFDRVDVALDAFPCTGMTTTCHSLWMGVPVVTLGGTTAVSRAGVSLLSTVGLPEWIAWTEQEYVDLAAAAARDTTRLGELRRTLRARMEASPLMNAPRFARNMEAAYRMMWERWCAQREV